MKEQIEHLERIREASDSPLVNFSDVLTLLSSFNKNKYLASTRRGMNEMEAVPLLIENELNREKKSVNDLALLKYNLKGKNYYELIMPYLEVKPLVFGCIDRFFDSELIISCPFMDRSKVYTDLSALYHEDMIKQNPSREDLLFIGQVLLIMRISYLSYFNCGYPTEEPPLLVDAQAYNLAVLCFDEAKFPTNITNLETTRLMLLIQFCHQYSPELIRWDVEPPFDKITDITKTAMLLGYNMESNDEYVRRVWHQIMEVDRTDFIYSGKSKSILYNSYTTDFSKRPTTRNDIGDVIGESLYQRNKFQNLYETLSNKIKNVRSLSKLEDYENHLRSILDYIKDISLEKLLKMKHETREDRALKSIYFNNFLDLNCLAYMIGTRIFLYYDDNSKTCQKSLESIETITKIVSSMLPLVYFIDPHQLDDYNLQTHFGYSIHLIPKILQCLHRTAHSHFTIYAKLKNEQTWNSKLESLKKIITQNLKVLLSALSNVVDRYLYGKRMHLIHSYLMISMFENPSMQNLFNLHQDPSFRPMDDSQVDAILKNLQELSGERKLSSEVYNEPLVGYFENLLSNSEQIEVDASTIEHIEKFLKNQSCCYDFGI